LKEFIDNPLVAKTLKKKEQAQEKLNEIAAQLNVGHDTVNTNGLSMEEIHAIIKSRVIKAKKLLK